MTVALLVALPGRMYTMDENNDFAMFAREESDFDTGTEVRFIRHSSDEHFVAVGQVNGQPETREFTMWEEMDFVKVVFAVLFCNFGDQGASFEGVFSTKQKAEAYVAEREPDEHERQWWDVVPVAVDEPERELE